MTQSPANGVDRRSVFEAVLHWSLFTVAFSLVPLGFAFFLTHLVGQGLRWDTFLSGGEGTLIASTIGFASFGELLKATDLSASRLVQMVVQGLNILLSILAALVFGALLLARTTNQPVDSQLAALATLILLLLAYFSSTCCIIIANHKVAERGD